MIIYEERNGLLVKLDENIISEEAHQVIVSTLNKPLLVNWLKAEELPEPFFEDIASFEQTPSFEDFSEGTVLILKYLKLEKEEFMDFYNNRYIHGSLMDRAPMEFHQYVMETGASPFIVTA